MSDGHGGSGRSDDMQARALSIAAAALAVVAVGFVLWRAWVCDDAFITFRHVVHCLSGHGPVFNVGERVQGFTHPLWFLLLLAGAALFDVYAVAVTLGLVLTAALVALLVRLYRGRRQALLALAAAVIILLGSRAFVEYQTSGLETSLTNALVVALLGAALRHAASPSDPPPVGMLTLLGSLLLMTRPDHLMISGPVLAWALVQAVRRRGRRPLMRVGAALLPMLLWYAFATIYYGSPLPNTAYAKVALPLPVAAAKGRHYVRDYAAHEPIHAGLTACVLVVGAAAALPGLVRRRPGAALQACVMLGLWLQFAYVIGVGGDFMRGRFLVSTVVGATAAGIFLLQARLPVREPGRPLCAALAAVGIVLAGVSSLYDARPRVGSQEAIDAAGGIADEWAWYAGPWNGPRFRPPETYRGNPFTPLWVRVGGLAARYSEQIGPITITWQAMGVLPYHAGPKVHVIDVYGLTDAFIARCPAERDSRIGHIEHDVPAAYLESRGVLNMLPDWGRRMEAMDPHLAAEAREMMRRAVWADPNAQQRWMRIRRMISGDLFSRERLADIPAYALGRL